MKIIKVIKDYIIKKSMPKGVVLEELFELSEYFRNFGAIKFEHKKGDNDCIIVVSSNFRYGSIIASGKNPKELEKNTRNAILTAFDVPSVYEKEVNLHPVGKFEKSHAFA